MNRRRWLLHIILRALGHRRGRTVLLLAVLAMASSLATALGIVSTSMEKRVAEEVRKYGANLIILPESARLDVGSGGLNFGVVSEPSYLLQQQVENSLAQSGLKAERSFHLRGALQMIARSAPDQRTLRKFAESRALSGGGSTMSGSPQTVADKMEEFRG